MHGTASHMAYLVDKYRGTSISLQKADQDTTENPQDCSSEKTLLSEIQEIEKRPSKDDMPNVVMFTNPLTGMKRRMKLQHLPRPFVEAVGIKPGQTVIVKRRIRVAKSARNQVDLIVVGFLDSSDTCLHLR